MYILLVTWIALNPPRVEEHYLYTYKSLDECTWAKQWVQEHNNISSLLKLECRQTK